MSSKEALEKYYSNLMYGNGGFQTDEEELEGLKAIKQDLECKEQLEKKNQELKDKYKELVKDFRKAIDIVKKYINAIQILKDKFVNIKLLITTNCYDEYCMHVIDNQLTEQEYDLLKEVLKEYEEKN